MDTIRIHKTAAGEPIRESTAFVIALLFGLVLLAMGIKLDSGLLAGIGFLPFSISSLYLNSMFWAKVFDGKKVSTRFKDTYKYWI